MVLSREEYEEIKKAWLDRYRNEMTRFLNEEKEKHLEKYLKEKTKDYFVSNYMGGVLLTLIVCLAGIVKDAFTLADVLPLFFVLLFSYGITYQAWKDEMKKAARNEFIYKEQTLKSYFVHEKMVEDINKASSDIAFQRTYQFYGVALYEIPREYYVHSDSSI